MLDTHFLGEAWLPETGRGGHQVPRFREADMALLHTSPDPGRVKGFEDRCKCVKNVPGNGEGKEQHELTKAAVACGWGTAQSYST